MVYESALIDFLVTEQLASRIPLMKGLIQFQWAGPTNGNCMKQLLRTIAFGLLVIPAFAHQVQYLSAHVDAPIYRLKMVRDEVKSVEEV